MTSKYGSSTKRFLNFALCTFLCLLWFASWRSYEHSSFAKVAFFSWIGSMLKGAFVCYKDNTFENLQLKSLKAIAWFFCLLVIYFNHPLFFSAYAPWNELALFDDAAWDIFFANKHVKSYHFYENFYPAYFDEVGYISREIVFSYYQKIFFYFYGHNLDSFNISLKFMGFLTFFFLVTWAFETFKHKFFTILITLWVLTFPMYFLQVFMGHRYAMALPLLAGSLFFIDKSFKNSNPLFGYFGGIFLGLNLASSILGKQIILVFALAFFFKSIFLIRRNTFFSKTSLHIMGCVVLGFLTSASPILIYILKKGSIYYWREQGLLQSFISEWQQNGFSFLRARFIQWWDIYATAQSPSRFFLPNIIPILPWMMWFFLVGIWYAVREKLFALLLLLIIPNLLSIIAGPLDFRVYHSFVAAWIFMILGMKFSLFNISSSPFIKIFCRVSFLLLVFTSIFIHSNYLWELSLKPHGLYLLKHRDVLISRFAQRVAIEDKIPQDLTPLKNELDIPQNLQKASVWLAPIFSYAVSHLFFQNLDPKFSLGLCETKPCGIFPSHLYEDNFRNFIQNNTSRMEKTWVILESGPETFELEKIIKKYFPPNLSFKDHILRYRFYKIPIRYLVLSRSDWTYLRASTIRINPKKSSK